MNTRRLQLVIDSTLNQVALLGEAIRAASVGVGLSPGSAAEVELCVVEAVKNAIKHAYQRTAGGEVRVTLRVDAEGLQIDVTDRGRAMPPEGGRSLGIVEDLMDEVRYEARAGENALTMCRRFAPVASV